MIPRTRSLHARRVVALLLAAALSTALEGCGDAPTAPATQEAPTGPPLLVVGTDGTSGFERVSGDAATGSRALEVTKEIDGSQGGWVRCGRFFLALSAGAFDSIGTVTMSMPDSTVMLVNLEIQPARLNGFHEPVYLAVNTTGTDAPSDSLALYWMNPKTGAWTDVTTEKAVTTATDCVTQVEGFATDAEAPTSNWATLGVTSTLQHFSKYSAGKAGW